MPHPSSLSRGGYAALASLVISLVSSITPTGSAAAAIPSQTAPLFVPTSSGPQAMAYLAGPDLNVFWANYAAEQSDLWASDGTAAGTRGSRHCRCYDSPMLTAADMEKLPGGDLIVQGLADLGAGRETVASLLVLVGAPRLRDLGLAVPEVDSPELPEHRLYHLLAEDGPDAAHSRYNAYIRRLVSFERTAECVS